MIQTSFQKKYMKLQYNEHFFLVLKSDAVCFYDILTPPLLPNKIQTIHYQPIEAEWRTYASVN